jgi:hypothetical protein
VTLCIVISQFMQSKMIRSITCKLIMWVQFGSSVCTSSTLLLSSGGNSWRVEKANQVLWLLTRAFISVCFTTKVKTKHSTSAAIGNVSMENDMSLRHDTLDKHSERSVTSSIRHARYAVTRRTCPATRVNSRQDIDTHTTCTSHVIPPSYSYIVLRHISRCVLVNKVLTITFHLSWTE